MHVKTAQCMYVFILKNIDEVIATIKNKDLKNDCHDAGLPSPFDPVITRWATWHKAALYYSENFPAVCTIVNNWTSAGFLGYDSNMNI